MHPFFTAMLSRFLAKVFDRHIEHQHPQLWKTKGQTLRELKESGLHEGWWKTKSCPRGRKVCMDHKRVQCGVCASCLLRRQSILAAGLDEAKDVYLWTSLSAPSLTLAATSGARNVGPSDERQAMCGVYDLAALANLSVTDSGNERIALASSQLRAHGGLQTDDPATDLRRLLDSHRSEWKTFVALQKSESFLHKWMEVLQC
jgi:hypothetical protein